MHILNLETGVKNALVGRLMERGITQAQAEAKAQAKLADAVAHVNSEATKAPEETGAPAPGSIQAVKAALASLKSWSAKNID